MVRRLLSRLRAAHRPRLVSAVVYADGTTITLHKRGKVTIVTRREP